MSQLDNPGYHLTAITKGKIGEVSKIAEELAELIDAEAQQVRVMALVELSDLIGAILLYLDKYYPGFALSDLEAMARVTRRAFTSGLRS